MSDLVRDLLCDTPPVMVLDMGLGSREQGFSVQTPKRVPVTAGLMPPEPANDRRA